MNTAVLAKQSNDTTVIVENSKYSRDHGPQNSANRFMLTRAEIMADSLINRYWINTGRI